jgi:hypothetical protein
MTGNKKTISIWYFVGLLLLAYGALIAGAGIYDLAAGIQRNTVHAELHPAIWWGALLFVLGLVYTVFFSPGRDKR